MTNVLGCTETVIEKHTITISTDSTSGDSSRDSATTTKEGITPSQVAEFKEEQIARVTIYLLIILFLSLMVIAIIDYHDKNDKKHRRI